MASDIKRKGLKLNNSEVRSNRNGILTSVNEFAELVFATLDYQHFGIRTMEIRDGKVSGGIFKSLFKDGQDLLRKLSWGMIAILGFTPYVPE